MIISFEVKNKISYILSNKTYIEKGWTKLKEKNDKLQHNELKLYEFEKFLNNQNNLESSIKIFVIIFVLTL